MMRATIQLCTYNRAELLERVLDACFEQTVPEDAYEVVLVDDGSTDATAAAIELARSRARCRFTVVRQPNSGLAKGRNAGIARATGERIVFIDDDVLVLPNFVEEHLRTHASHPPENRARRSDRGRKLRRSSAARVEHQELQRELLLDDQRFASARDDSRHRWIR